MNVAYFVKFFIFVFVSSYIAMSKRKISDDVLLDLEAIQDDLNTVDDRQQRLIAEVENVDYIARGVEEEFAHFKVDMDSRLQDVEDLAEKREEEFAQFKAKVEDNFQQLQMENESIMRMVMQDMTNTALLNKIVTAIVVGMKNGATPRHIANCILAMRQARDSGVFDSIKMFEEEFENLN